MRKLFKHIGMICLALAVAVGSFFVPIRSPNQSLMAGAASVDVNYYFHSNDTYYIAAYDYNDRLTSSDYLLYNGDIAFNSSSGVSTRTRCYTTTISGLDITYNSIGDLRLATKSSSVGRYGFDDYFNLSYETNYRLSLTHFGHTFFMYFFVQDGFNANIYKVDLGLTDTNFWDTGGRDDSDYFRIRYYDVEDRFFDITFIVSTDFYYNSRTYYFFDPSDLTDSQQYNQGYQHGLADNQQNIYNNGYNAGFDDGFSDGKSEGIVESNNYSFISLFGALFDAPVTMLIGLLNFDFLGINLWAFVTSLFTLALVLFIIKLIMGR